MRRRFLLTSLIGLALASPAWSRAAPERRCGWIVNPTPGNWWLRDRDGEWTISAQGGFQAGGIELPDMSTHGWVVTNGLSYGHGCACLTGTFDRKTMRVVRLTAARSRPLKQCRADRSLPKP